MKHESQAIVRKLNEDGRAYASCDLIKGALPGDTEIIFNINEGQISFALQSRYSFAQRQASASSPRTAFDVRDGNGTHLFYFVTQVNSGNLQFSYMAGGSAQFYFVPKGTEDKLFGSGATLRVTLAWNPSSLKLYLNGVVVKTTASSLLAATWASTSNFDLGAFEYLNFGGYLVSDDAIGDFTVNARAAVDQ